MKQILSPTELKVMKILGRKKMTIAEITKELYKRRKRPFRVHNTIATCVNRITEKTEFYDLNWTLESKKLGRSKVVWREKRT